MRQERAVQTRHRLIRAAAAEFARHGAAGTSLARVCASGEATMGALTFHFPSKRQLADTVRKQGLDTTRATARAAVRPGLRLQSVIDITHVVALLLEDNVVVRAANRLCQEAEEGRHEWYTAWLDTVHTLAVAAGANGELNSRVAPRQVALLAACFVSGFETSAVAAGTTSTAHRMAVERVGPVGPHRHLAQLWRTVIPSVASPEAVGRLRPDDVNRGTSGAPFTKNNERSPS